MDLGECEAFVREVTPDRGRAQSLRELADAKERVAAAAPTEETVAVYVSLMYDALHETLSASALERGYACENHVCLGVLLKTLDEDFDLEGFERCRKARNRINYDGRKIGLVHGKSLIAEMRSLKRRYCA